jgi:transposase-like protein
LELPIKCGQLNKRNWLQENTMGIQHKSSRRKQYSSEFKREAVAMITRGGLSIAQVARDLGLSDNMISRWKKEAEQNGSVLSAVRGILKMRNYLGCGVRSRCCARSEKS